MDGNSMVGRRNLIEIRRRGAGGGCKERGAGSVRRR